MTSASKLGARRTSALKFIEDDLQLPKLRMALVDADKDLSAAADNHVVWKKEYDSAKAQLDELESQTALDIAEKERIANSKVTQEAIKRAIAEYQFIDEQHQRVVGRLRQLRVNLDDATAEWEKCRHTHRMLVTMINSMTEQMRFQAASKEAATAAVSHLAAL